MPLTTKATTLFSGGFACSQAVLLAFCDKYGLDETMALRIAAGFGGGMKSAEACGAISGAVMVIGLRYGHVDTADREARRFAGTKVEQFMHAFRNKHQHLTCRDLLGCDITTAEGRQTALDGQLFTTRCVDLVGDAVRILQESGY